ncbi:MAG: AI-2E family transporter [archaeon]
MAINNQYQRIVPFILFILALFMFFELIHPVITIILSSILLSYISFPVYRRIRKKISNKSVSILLSLMVIVIIILIPISFLAVGIGQQGYYFYNSLSSSVAKGALLGFSCNSEDSKVCMLVNQAEQFSVEQLSKFGFDKQLQIYLPVLEEKIKNMISGIPFIIAHIFLTLVITYFILKDHKNILKKISDLIPIRSDTKKRLIEDFGNIAYSVIYAQLFVALVQGIVGMMGFYIFGVPFPILSGILIAFFALVPFIGTSIIWVPASLYLIMSGYFTQDYLVLGKGIGLLLYGIFIIATIDNILLANIVKAKANVSPIIVILGVIGGVSVFGIIGIFIGPILLPLLITYFETFKERFI